MSRTVEMVIKVTGQVVERIPMNTGYQIAMAHNKAFSLQSPKEKARSLRDIGRTGAQADVQYLTLIEGWQA